MTFRKVASVADLWDGDMQGLSVGGAKVLLVKLDGELCAYEDRCAHLGVQLSEGKLEGGVIECSAHHYQYDARTGQGVNPRTVCLRRYPVRVEDGTVWVEVDAPAA